MKTIGRILIILVAASIVIGATVAFSRTDLAAELLPSYPGGEFMPDDAFGGEFEPGEIERASPDVELQRPEGGPGRGFNLFNMLKNIATIGLIVLGVVLFDRFQRVVSSRLQPKVSS